MYPKLKFHAPVEIQAKSKGPRRFIARAYNGGVLRIPAWDLPVVIDLAGLTPRPVVAANLDHDQAQRVGQVDDVQNDGRTLTLSGVVSAASTAAQEFVESAARGYRWGASIEASPDEVEQLERGQTAIVNGRTVHGPLYLTRKSTLVGVAFLAVPADAESSVSIAARLRGFDMSADASFQDWVCQMTTADPADLTAEQLAGFHAQYHGRLETTAADRAAVLPMIAASGDPVEAEARRLRQIEAATRGEWGEHGEAVAALKASAIEGALSVDSLLEQLRPIRSEIYMSKIPAAHTVSTSRRDQHPEFIVASLCLAGGLTNPERHFSEQVLDQASRMVRDASLQSLLMSAACQGGYHARPGEYVTQGNIRAVLAAAFGAPIKATGFSSNVLSNVLSNVASKMLLDGFNEMPSEWRAIADVRPVRNFKETKFVRLLDAMEFDELGPAGEIKHGTLGDATLAATASTYAKMLAITRQDIINDDLGALTDVPRRLGRAAGQKFNRLFWAAFNASDGFWSAPNGNIATGAGTALDVEGVGMTAAIQAFRAQRSTEADGGKLIGGRPAVLLCPPALEINARRLLTSTGIVSGSDGMIPSGNPFAGLCTLVVEDRLSAAEGGDDAQWYLLRAPSFAPAMLVVALNGRVEPTVETAEADFNTLGVQMRGYSDVGVARGEPLCGLQMAGTPGDS